MLDRLPGDADIPANRRATFGVSHRGLEPARALWGHRTDLCRLTYANRMPRQRWTSLSVAADGPAFLAGVRRSLGKVIVHDLGSVECGHGRRLRDRLADVIDGQGNRHLVVDLKGLTSIDAAGIPVLVVVVKRMQRHGGEFVLSAPTIDVSHALDAAGLDSVYVVTPA